MIIRRKTDIEFVRLLVKVVFFLIKLNDNFKLNHI